MSPRIVVARLGRSHGLHGYQRVESFCEPADNVCSYSMLYMRPVKGDWSGPLSIEWERKGERLFARLPEITTPEHARAYAGYELGVDRSVLPALPDGQYYWADLVGLAVHSTTDGCLGVVDSIFNNGPHDIMVVTTPDGHQLYLPHVPQVVQHIDLQAGQIRVAWEKTWSLPSGKRPS